MCLKAQVIDDGDGGFGRLIRTRRLSNDNGGVRRGRGKRNTSKGLETTTEAAGAQRRAQGIYDGNGCIGGER